MAMATRGPLSELYFGFDVHRLFVRLDCEGPARAALGAFDSVRVGFLEPAGFEVRIDNPGRKDESVRLLRGGARAVAPGLEASIGQIAEVAVPFDALGVPVGGPVHFFVDVLEAEQSRDRAPREGTITLSRPSPDFERIMWDV
jgi:hypothetical protein